VATTQDLSLALKAKLFRGLADPSRLAIIEALRPGEHSVSEIVLETGLSQPNVSAHLHCLRDCGLVTSRQQGRFVFYALVDRRMEDVLSAVEEILSDVAARVYACTRYNEQGQGADNDQCL